MKAYGHRISFDLDIGNAASPDPNAPAIRIVKEGMPLLSPETRQKWALRSNQGREIALCTDRRFARTVKGQRWWFDVADVATFGWESGSATLHYHPGKAFTPDHLRYWSLQIVLPLFFTIEETYDFLHAGAVLIAGKPILFTAESFGGKSTLTDYFIRRGHPMVSDDKVALTVKDGLYHAVPSHPHHRPYRKTEDLGYAVDAVAPSPLPIHAIYALERARSDATVKVEELRGVEKFKALRFSSEMNFPFLKPARLQLLASLANTVPLYRVIIPWDIARLNEVYNAICEYSQGRAT